MYTNRRNFRALKKIWVEEHDGNVRFYTGSGNIAVSRMRSENVQYNPYYILSEQFGRCGLAMGQIPCTFHRRCFYP